MPDTKQKIATGRDEPDAESKIRTIQYYDGEQWVVLTRRRHGAVGFLGWDSNRRFNPYPHIVSIEEILASRRGYADALREALTANDDVNTALKFLDRSVNRLRQIAAEDMPPSLVRGEADFIANRVAEIRAALSKHDQVSG